MQHGDEDINEFMALYRTEFGKDISREDAFEMATRLINLYLIIYRPLPGERGDRTTRFRSALRCVQRCPFKNTHFSLTENQFGVGLILQLTFRFH